MDRLTNRNTCNATSINRSAVHVTRKVRTTGTTSDQNSADVAPKPFLTATEPARLQALGAGVVRVQSWKGMVFEIQTTAALDLWSPLTTVTDLTGTLDFADLDAASQSRRFYQTVAR